MAAAANAQRTALERLGFTNEAATQMVDNEGIDDIEIIRDLTDEDIANLCKTLRQPGGTIPNPNAAVAGQPATIPNRGFTVSMIAEKNLRRAVYWLQYRNNADRTTTWADITVPNVRSIDPHLTELDNHKDPTGLPDKIIDTKNWRKSMELVDEHIRAFRGGRGHSLLYLC